ncbi:hypothetical protein SLEP1_g5256 [Rubroshorea leprosula]|uniref:Uncharacterized protein n=1 Tax=Rubroshorea leprosula TaxID=152421 RepID=A0AAV5I167_9ROSI|nr:hypothetical protein SLEP1_g5256 [Rubroshorea leprosula]
MEGAEQSEPRQVYRHSPVSSLQSERISTPSNATGTTVTETSVVVAGRCISSHQSRIGKQYAYHRLIRSTAASNREPDRDRMMPPS